MLRLNETDKFDILWQHDASEIKKMLYGGYSRSVLHIAASYGAYDIINLILSDGGMEVDRTDEEDFTPLMVASNKGHKMCVVTLIEFDADLFKRNIYGRNALGEAYSSDEEVTSLLREK